MIRKNQEMTTEVRHQMRGGDGSTVITHIYKKDELKGNSRLCARISLEPGASIGDHKHENEEEIYYILSGQGVVVDEGVPREVVAGDAVLTRDGATHAIKNTGNQALEFIAVINTY